MSEFHITLETLALMIGVVSIVGPVFYLAGRFNQRLTNVERQIESMLVEGLQLTTRIVTALEALVITLKDADRHLTERKD